MPQADSAHSTVASADSAPTRRHFLCAAPAAAIAGYPAMAALPDSGPEELPALRQRIAEIQREIRRLDEDVIEPTNPRIIALASDIPPELLDNRKNRQLLGRPSFTSRTSWCGDELREKLNGDLSPEARARATELLEIYDEFWGRVSRYAKESGHDAATAAQDALYKELDDIEIRILAMKPATLDVIQAKLECVKRWFPHIWRVEPAENEWDDLVLRQAVDSILGCPPVSHHFARPA